MPHRRREAPPGPKISLALIARNEEKFLPECLRSIEGAVDEVVVADTGSTDGTAEIAEAHRARVVELEWTDDFAAARNFAIEQATGEILLILDADERLSPGSARAIRRAARQRTRDAWRLTLLNIGPDGPTGDPVQALRLFRKTERFHYLGRIHEQPMLERPERTGPCGAHIEHFHDAPGTPRENDKTARNRRLLELGLAETEGSGENVAVRSLYLFHHALQGDGDERRGRWQAFADFVRQRAERLRDAPPWVPCGLVHHAAELHHQGRDQEAADIAGWTLERFGEAPALRGFLAYAALRRGEPDAAERHLRAGRNRKPAPLHRGRHPIPKAAARLPALAEAELRERQQRWAEAERLYRAADDRGVATRPRLACVQAIQGKSDEALATLEGAELSDDLACLALALSLDAQKAGELLRYGERVRAAAGRSTRCASMLARVERLGAAHRYRLEDFPEVRPLLYP